MGGHFRLEGQLELRQLEDGHGGWDCLISDGRSLRTGRPVGVEAAGRRTRRLGVDSHFRLEGQLEIKQLEDGHGGWDCLCSDARSLQTGRPVGDQAAGGGTPGFGTVLSRMGVHFRLEGRLGIKQLEEGHRGWDCLVSSGRSLQGARRIGLSCHGWVFTSDWKASWRRDTGVGTVLFRVGDRFRLEGQVGYEQLEDGHGGWDCLVTDGCSLQTGRPVVDQAAGGGTLGLGLSCFGWEITSDWKASWGSSSWRRDTGVGTVLFRVGDHFRLEGQLEVKQLEDGHGVWDCLSSDGRSLKDWKVSWGSSSWRRDTGVGTVLFRVGDHFRLEGQLEYKQLEDGHGGLDCLVTDGCSLQTGRPVGVEAAGRRAWRLGLSHFGCEVT